VPSAGSPPIPYVPQGYVRRAARGFVLWHSAEESARHVRALEEATGGALSAARALLEWINRRVLNVCCYHDATAARRALDRDVSPTMALAPYAGPEASLIVVQSSNVDPRNGDRDRMLRIVAHEITHQFVFEATGSRKILGDENRDVRVPAWLNEGLAEVAGYLAVGNENALAEIERRCESMPRQLNSAEIDRALDDFSSPYRPDAFAAATAAVWGHVRRYGIAWVFKHLGDPSWVAPIGGRSGLVGLPPPLDRRRSGGHSVAATTLPPAPSSSTRQ
jgi:hypothetical protein